MELFEAVIGEPDVLDGGVAVPERPSELEDSGVVDVAGIFELLFDAVTGEPEVLETEDGLPELDGAEYE